MSFLSSPRGRCSEQSQGWCHGQAAGGAALVAGLGTGGGWSGRSVGVFGDGGHPVGRLGASQCAVPLSIRVAGSQLVDGSGQPVRLLGVDRSGSEYACIQGWGFFDGPSDQASVAAIASWHANAVRIALNEDCWLGINGVSSAFGGANYQTAIENYVNLLNQNGIYAILELHWSAPGVTPATGQEPMPDADHSSDFWSSVASAFKNNPAVLFDLFNEPYPDNNQDTTAAWTCWQNGGTCPGVSFTTVGMQSLVNTVRAAGSEQRDHARRCRIRRQRRPVERL